MVDDAEKTDAVPPKAKPNNGMVGVFLVAAELSKLGFTVSPTSRNAAGADLLVTDAYCARSWSVQVKTNGKPAGFWLVGAQALNLRTESHVYVFVNLCGDKTPEFRVVPSAEVARLTKRVVATTGSVFYEFRRSDWPESGDWNLFKT